MGYYSDYSGGFTVSGLGSDINVVSNRVEETLADDSLSFMVTHGDGEDVFDVEVTSDSTKWYGWVDDLKRLDCLVHYAGGRLSGCVERHGEEWDDLQRAVFTDDGVRVDTARIVWPDGTDV
ncbi:hypothetical protein [Bifidobacterium oedipodis]|uniref:Uncharacterized protein n=1 Tax=Bifidobacterium oedipodis TaxID=2675322 RepID=A0A7Y0EP80_9BIFI|nr:hypothetical protein [Bifidobacterium sp. DSM 109957]NMM93897.1 hypothetical protein [Bifidobacterium sp. DSM 109957]